MNTEATTNETVPQPAIFETSAQTTAPIIVETPSPSLSETGEVAKPRRLWSRIQSLPVRTRNWLNRSLRDGVPYKHLITDLEKKGHPISKQQLSAWVKSGYQLWLAEQQLMEDKRLRIEAIADATAKSTRATRKAIRDSDDLNVALQIHDALQSTNTDALRNLLADKPETFFRLIRAHSAHERNALMRDRSELEAKKLRLLEAKENRLKPKNRNSTLSGTHSGAA